MKIIQIQNGILIKLDEAKSHLKTAAKLQSRISSNNLSSDIDQDLETDEGSVLNNNSKSMNA